MHIILSRIDSIGDVVLTLPMAGLIKEKYPEAEISFIGRSYTEPVVKLSIHINRFVNWDNYSGLPLKKKAEMLRELKADWIIHVFPNRKLARAAHIAGIPNRAGTSHRIFHILTCNKRITFSRRRSELHEAQLNCKLLAPLAIDVPVLKNIPKYYGLSPFAQVSESIRSLLDPERKNIVLHPKSKGSAREWGLQNFDRLIQLLPEDRFKLFVSGTLAEAQLMKEFLDKNHNRIIDITGKLSLDEFIAFLSLADAIVAASTGPLHLAAALGRMAVGIYPPIRPMHPGRWAPLGEKVKVLVKDVPCEECRKSMDCHCIREIAPEQVLSVLENFIRL
jgi:heptosyltransferase III